ncbi:MAG: hemolysin family protein [Caulobacteraceae bacterium]
MDPVKSEETSPRPPVEGPLKRLLSALGLAPRVAKRLDPAEKAAADLVGHAEAFSSLAVADVMTPRADIRAVEISQPFEDVVAAFAESEHSRLPVFRRELDDPVGVVHLKDVFKRLAATPDGARGESALRRLLRETLYVPPSMRAADLMVRMQARRIHMAMVIDEFGGLDGIVTLEDLIESVVGEIDDEHDETQTARIVIRQGGVIEADARVDLDELEEAVGGKLDFDGMDEDIDTAGGLVTALAGHLPERGEVIAHPAGLEFEILDADPRRIKRMRVRPVGGG